METLVKIKDWLRSCDNCKWHGKNEYGDGECKKPGGWRHDPEYKRCIDFERLAPPTRGK